MSRYGEIHLSVVTVIKGVIHRCAERRVPQEPESPKPLTRPVLCEGAPAISAIPSAWLSTSRAAH